MLKYDDLKKGDILVSNFDEFEGTVTARVNFYACVYLTDENGKVRRVYPESLGGYTKKENEIHVQQILTFVSYKRDHAAVWNFMEFVPNDPGNTSPEMIMQDRTGQWWLCYRNLHNTNEQATKSIARHTTVWDYCEEVVVYLQEG